MKAGPAKLSKLYVPRLGVCLSFRVHLTYIEARALTVGRPGFDSQRRVWMGWIASYSSPRPPSDATASTASRRR